ncbi:hypothetical protein F652_1747 [Enterobacteriaceae bacterium bta3-1]|nr:hypothetical protein F652_1747 [Enterobacteriaceae bacterium bta3-1]
MNDYSSSIYTIKGYLRLRFLSASNLFQLKYKKIETRKIENIQ